MSGQVLKFCCRGEWYKVKPNGDLLQVANTYNEWGETWKFLGVSFHHWRQGIDLSVTEAFQEPKKLIGGLVWDRDHGTSRQWGGQYNGKLPRITQAYTEQGT